MRIPKILLGAVASVLLTVSSFAQGTISFNTRVLADDGVSFLVNAVVTQGGTAVSGAAYLAQLYVGANANSLAAVGSPVIFRTGTRAGYVDISAPDITTTLAAGSTATVVMRAWLASAGATYEAALAARGSSAPITVTLGGAGSPPSLPANLLGLQGFAIVPEPSVIALGALGLGALIFRRKTA